MSDSKSKKEMRKEMLKTITKKKENEGNSEGDYQWNKKKMRPIYGQEGKDKE